ncbi:MAG TPA: cytochrome C oxidase subunit IV family protein [Thermoanaerobaculia bacterium]
MSEHSSSLMPYVLVLVGLLALTALTVLVALVDFGHPWSDAVALAIALSKASLVVLFFMHVKGSTPLIKLAAAGGFFWMLIFFAFILSDVLERTTLVSGWE